MPVIKNYPDFIPLSIELKNELHPRLSLTPDGVSEFSFSGLYLFRDRYNYRISRIPSVKNEGAPANVGGFIISGEQPGGSAESASGWCGGKRFFMTPCEAPDRDTLKDLFATHDYWKNIPESVLEPVKEELEAHGVVFTEDRDNFDYLYNRSDLAELSGKKFHKKKNHVNQFMNNYPNHSVSPLSLQTAHDAIKVLDVWRQNSNLREDGDYKAAKEALELFDVFNLKGSVFYIDGNPAAYCSGESIARGRMFAVHFEKANAEYHGIYQFVNKSFAASLPRFFTLINREQDLGDEGLRQAKMTYRPCGFVKKWRAVLDPAAKLRM